MTKTEAFLNKHNLIQKLEEELKYFISHPTHSEFVHDFVRQEKGCFTCQHKQQAIKVLKLVEELNDKD